VNETGHETYSSITLSNSLEILFKSSKICVPLLSHSDGDIDDGSVRPPGSSDSRTSNGDSQKVLDFCEYSLLDEDEDDDSIHSRIIKYDFFKLKLKYLIL
jgi:hypothetical protein